MKLWTSAVGATESRPSGSETFFRRLTLTGPTGAVFLDRFGVGTRWFGFYLHRILDADPGLDLHDHPWPFVSLILHGGYEEEAIDSREAPRWAAFAENFGVRPRGWVREWGRWSIHRMPLTIAHRITAVRPHTWTLVLRGRKSRSWGFYLPDGFVDQRSYDYVARRPVTETRT